jgi:hypothetical protein
MAYSVDREYIVLSDVRNESELAVLATTGLPIIGVSSLAGFPGAICRALNPVQDQRQPHLWSVRATFSTDTIQQEPPNTGPNGSPNLNPTTWIPIYRGRMEYYQEVIYKDFSSPPKDYVNYAGVPFSEPLVVNKPIVVYDFWQFESNTVTDKQIGERTDKINSSSVTRGSNTWPAKTLKISVVEFERGFFYGFACVNIHYMIAYKPSTWAVKPLQVGYEYRLVAGGVRVASPKLVALETDGTLRDDSLPVLSNNEFLPHDTISFGFLR